jgi:Asp-tRNA(Asn)/Glu-tRNA(Gln) amidotransferase A subunit family amidase
MMTDDVDRYTRSIMGAIGFTSLFNTAGNPAMSVPLGWSRTGLPIGVQFAAPFGDEAGLFRLGAQLEAAEPWAGRRPPVVTARRQP